MSEKVTELTICLGSSCFARGNRKTVTVLQEYLREHDLNHLVQFRGNHCFGKCNKGPILKVNERIFEGIDDQTAIAVIEKELGKLKTG